MASVDSKQTNSMAVLAKLQEEKLAELQRLFLIEAVKYNVLPLDNTKVERLDVSNRPSNIRGLNEFTYYDGMTRIPEGSAPDLKNKSFGISAAVEIPEGGAEGLLMTQGGRFAGLPGVAFLPLGGVGVAGEAWSPNGSSRASMADPKLSPLAAGPSANGSSMSSS